MLGACVSQSRRLPRLVSTIAFPRASQSFDAFLFLSLSWLSKSGTCCRRVSEQLKSVPWLPFPSHMDVTMYMWSCAQIHSMDLLGAGAAFIVVLGRELPETEGRTAPYLCNGQSGLQVLRRHSYTGKPTNMVPACFLR